MTDADSQDQPSEQSPGPIPQAPRPLVDAPDAEAAEVAAEDSSVADMLAASLGQGGGDDDEEMAGGLLTLPDGLVDGEAAADLDPAQLAAALDGVGSADDDGLSLPEPASPADGSDSAAASDGAHWSADADSTPLLVEGSDDEEQGLREQINQRISGLGDDTDEPIPDLIDVPAPEIRAALEALLLVSNRPLSEDRLCACLPGVQVTYLRGLLQGLASRYRHEYRGWDLRHLAGGWQLLTRPDLHPWVRQLDKHELPSKLSKSAMETLAIVAYKQPVTRGDIEDIRGVQCGPMLRQLMDLKLVQVVGRNDDAVGRPLLYGTSTSFLDRFGLGSLADLPRRHEFGE